MPRVSPSLFDSKPPRHSAEDAVVRKWIEEEAVGHFLNAYEAVTADQINVRPHERPDFVGHRLDGSPVGIELTAIRWTPDARVSEAILGSGEGMDAWEVLDRIGLALDKKARKRSSPGWTHPDSTIVLLMLEDAQLDGVHWVFDPTLDDEWASYGFQEIWVGDYTELDAYRDIELFGLYPRKWWGYHRRVFRKPYG
ncbi:MAG TPA: hypothetical protein VF263_00380 [Longimicrobiaceae bacterium]